jgi:hypothetical protein
MVLFYISNHVDNAVRRKYCNNLAVSYWNNHGARAPFKNLPLELRAASVKAACLENKENINKEGVCFITIKRMKHKISCAKLQKFVCVIRCMYKSNIKLSWTPLGLMFSILSMDEWGEAYKITCCLSFCPPTNNLWTNWYIFTHFNRGSYQWTRLRCHTFNPLASTTLN